MITHDTLDIKWKEEAQPEIRELVSTGNDKNWKQGDQGKVS